MRNITHKSLVGYGLLNNRDISKRILMFIKNNIIKDIDITNEWVNTFVTFMVRAVT